MNKNTIIEVTPDEYQLLLILVEEHARHQQELMDNVPHMADPIDVTIADDLYLRVKVAKAIQPPEQIDVQGATTDGIKGSLGL